MSNLRQRAAPQDDAELGLLVRTYAVTHPASLAIDHRSIDWHQLAYAAQGVMTVRTATHAWVVPPLRAVWIPAERGHSIHMNGRVKVRSLFFNTDLCRQSAALQRCRALTVSPLLRELVLHTVARGLLWATAAADVRLAGVIVDQLEAAETVAALALPMPTDPQVAQAADILLASQGKTDLDGVAKALCMSRRSLERRFDRSGTLSLGRFRKKTRLLAALAGLAQGKTTQEAADIAGYEGPSAFIHAFRRELGTTPQRWLSAQQPRGSEDEPSTAG